MTALKQSRWLTFKEDTIESMAERLWVHPRALREAQKELDEDRKRLGLSLVTVGSHAKGKVRPRPRTERKRFEDFRSLGDRKFRVDMPLRVHEDWTAYLQLRDVNRAVLLRSLIHALLTSSENPRWLGRGWVYRGRREVMEGYKAYTSRKKGWPYYALTVIPMGVHLALQRRAAVSLTTPTGLVRGQILELLEGRLTKISMINSTAQLYEDPDRYITLD